MVRFKVEYKLETLTMNTSYIKSINLKHITLIRLIIKRTKSWFETPLTFQKNCTFHAVMYN